MVEVGGGGSHGRRLPASPQPQVDFGGSIIIEPNKPLMFWNKGSDGNRLSEPSSTGVYVRLPALLRLIVPAYQRYLMVSPMLANWSGWALLFQPTFVPKLVTAS